MADALTDRDPFELLAADYMERLRQGQSPAIEDYAARHPELAAEIRELFPTIAATERLKARKARSSGGLATLGAAQLTRLGDFRIVREIGRGGMGVVFEAEQESLGRRVAVKVLPRQVLLDDKHLKRFEREARIAANLHHTNIVEVFGVGEQDGFHYYVMQYIHGAGLDAVIPRLAKWAGLPAGSQPGAAPDNEIAETAVRQLLGEEAAPGPGGRLGPAYWRSVARIGLQAAGALHYAHTQGTLHRDIKPANLLLDTQGTLWLADFGLAKAAQSGDISFSHDVVGTLRYMAPEQFRGETDHRSDIYSLGLTLYEMLSLQSAYEETDRSGLIHRITQGPPLGPPGAGLGIPRDLETIVLKAISHDATQRYQSVAALADDLGCFLEDRPIRARRVGPVERLGRWCRRNPSLAALAGTTLFSLVLVAVVATVGYVRTNKAWDREKAERGKAENNANVAIEALNRLFERLSPARLRTLPPSAVPGAREDGSDAASSPILSREAAALLEEMLPFYERLAQGGENAGKLRSGTAGANQRVGAIRQRLGQFDEAVKAYRRAIALYEELRAGAGADPKARLEIARINNELGRLYHSRRRLPEAREAFLAAQALLQTDAGPASGPAEERYELARTCYFLGIGERPLPAADPRSGGRPAPASEAQRDSLARAVSLLQDLPASPSANPEYQHLLALCYLEGAAVEGGRGRGPEGGAEQAIGILENLVQACPGIPDYAYDLSEAYARLHIPRPPIPFVDERMIQDRFGKALALLEKLVAKYPEVPDFLTAQARLHDKLGAFHRQLERWEEAEQNFRRAIAIQAPLVRQFPEAPHYGLWLATFRIALADALIRRGQSGEARTELEDTLATLLRQLAGHPEMPRPYGLLELGYSRLEMALRQAGERDLADEAGRQAEAQRPR
jgi:serine/threonine protein kinase/tetratricopeptide (TPR) repeat protein